MPLIVGRLILSQMTVIRPVDSAACTRMVTNSTLRFPRADRSERARRRAAVEALLGRAEGIGKLRGRWFKYENAFMARPIPALATFHPAYLLRSPGQKRKAWDDLRMAREIVSGQRP